jgi:uncharacterized membrane protein YkvA (DUF1232 family)
MHLFDTLKSTAKVVRQEVTMYRLVIKDSRRPKVAKVLLGLALGYAALPFDLIADFLRVIGHLDDLIIVPALVIMALKMIPKEVIEDCRARARGA